MIRLTKLTDYGLVIMTHFATQHEKKILNARDVAESVGLPLPTVSKLLKAFARNGLLTAHRGVHGGYSLSRCPEKILLPESIEIFEGPIAVTECQENGESECLLGKKCPVRTRWRPINEAVRQALTRVTLAQMAGLMPLEGEPGNGIGVANKNSPKNHGNCHKSGDATKPLRANGASRAPKL